jgi:hypothetical protein
MDPQRIWRTFVDLSVFELLLLACLSAVVLAGLVVAGVMYGRLALDNWRTYRRRHLQRRAWIEGHAKLPGKEQSEP